MSMTSVAHDTLETEIARFFSDPAQRTDPQAFWRLLREQGGPVYFSETMGEWYISGYAESYATLVHHAKQVAYSPRADPNFDASHVGEFRETTYNTLLFLMDPPAHGRLRDAAKKTFSGPMADQWRPRITGWIENCLAVVEPGESFDFVSTIARVFPGELTCALFGLPVADYPMIQRYAEGYLGLLEPNITEEREEAANAAGRAFTNYLAPFVERRLAGGPAGDLLDELLEAERAGVITRDGISAFMLMLLVGGHQTIAGTLGNGVMSFHENPDQWDLMLEEPSRSVPAVEELLRYSTPLNLQVKHFMKTDVDLGGTVIPKDGPNRIVTSAANRDPRVFADPEKFDILRKEGRHLGLGFGPHFCLGAAFARVELQEFFEALARRRVRLVYDATIGSRSSSFLDIRSIPRRWSKCAMPA